MAMRSAAGGICTATTRSTIVVVVLILMLSLFCMIEASSTSSVADSSSCASEKECSYTITVSEGLFTSRKILMGLMRRDNHHVVVDEKKELSSTRGSTSTYNKAINVDVELRNVPAGPDPLHHNGGSPKRPRSSSMKEIRN